MSFAEARRPRSGFFQRLDFVYFALAAFDLLTICTALYLNHIATTAFEEGVRTSAIWSQRQADLITLSRLAKEANAPGNEVFFSRRPGPERTVFEQAVTSFNAERARVAAEIAGNRISGHDDDLLRQIDLIQDAVNQMASQTQVIFTEFERGEERTAGRNMAVLDRAFHVLLGRLDDALAVVEAGRAEHLEAQLARARQLRTLETVIAFAVILIVVLVALYGSHVGRTLRAGETLRARMMEELKAGRDRLQHYADDVSHELRGPISKMRLDAEVLLQMDRTPQQYQAGVESILMECQRLSAMVESLLFLARAENTRTSINRTRLDVGKELELIREFFAAAAEHGEIRLVVDASDGVVQADRTLFQRAVSNLVSNALAHTKPGGVVSLRSFTEAGNVVVRVSDTGTGIDAALLPRVFDRFQRGAEKTPHQGLGLGLAIAKSIMELHGGAITLTSPRGEGLTAELQFPVGAAASQRLAPVR